MSDTPALVPVAQPGAPSIGTPATNPTTPPPAAPADPTPANVNLDQLDPAALDELAARIEATRANRPPSIAEAIKALEGKLETTHRQKDEQVDARKAAAAEADQLNDAISQLHRTIRRTELMEAATAAGFKAPAVVADHLLHRDGEVAALVTELAGSGAFTMRTPARSADVSSAAGGGAAGGVDPGMAALIAEINAAHGRT